LFIVGNTPELGEWDKHKAKKMTWNCGTKGGKRSKKILNLFAGNIWDINVGFEMDTWLEYKYFVKTDGSHDVLWEGSPNRYIHLFLFFLHLMQK
jgi:hypothetical protein